MIRKLLALVSFATMAFFYSAGVATADENYVPPAVTTSVVSTSPVPTASGVSGALSYTGAGFSVGGAVAIAAVVLLLGVALLVVGAKMTRRRSVGH